MSSDEIMPIDDQDTTYADQVPDATNNKALVQYMGEIEGEKARQLQEMAPALVNNPHQIFGYTPTKEVPLLRAKIKKLSIIGKIARGDRSIDDYYDTSMIEYIAGREINRSVEGHERQQVTSTHHTEKVMGMQRSKNKLESFLDRVSRNH
jgi:hypothetical protein